jgi:DNA-binding Lrp family transcriptional regulator
MLAYVLVSLKKKAEAEVYDDLKAIKEVKVVHMLFGEWDLIAKIDAKSPDALSTIVLEKIRTIPEVEMTSTLIVAK